MHATAAVISKPRFQDALTSRRFYAGMGVAMLATVFVGFARSYFLRGLFVTGDPGARPLTPLLHVHAVANLTWLFLFLAQTSLIASHRTDLHKKLGLAAVVIAPAAAVLDVMVAIHDARRGPLPIPFLSLPLGDALIFFGCTAAGFWFRHKPEIHKRLMLLGTVSTLAAAAIKRLPYVLQHDNRAMLLIALSLAAAPICDRVSRGRVSRLNLWGGFLIYLSIPARFALGRTELWHRFAVWLIR